MPNTIELGDLTEREAWRASTMVPDPEAPPTAPGEMPTYVGLSPFNIPREIRISSDDGKCAVFTFEYPDHEPASEEWLELDPQICLRLGQHTRKIIEIKVSDLYRFLVAGAGRIPMEALQEIAEDYPSRMRKVLIRNAAFINTFLSSLPESIRGRVQQDLRLRREPSSE